MKFLSAKEVFVTGYLWQKYRGDENEAISRGFIQPDAVNRRISETYRRKEGETETID